jgi:WhiB family transcriptional regulator, redox-sensing transcriptional regulator
MTTTWMARARCRDLPPEIFFPTDGGGVEVARRVCAACPVREPCLEYALAEHIAHGVWGGASERARQRILAARRPIEPLAPADSPISPSPS